MKKYSLYIGLILSLSAIAIIIYGACDMLVSYISHKGYNLEATYGVVTDVHDKNVDFTYQVNNKDYNGTLTFDYETTYEQDSFISVYYDKTDPQIVYRTNYKNDIITFAIYILIAVIGIIIIVYILFKKYQLKKYGNKKPLVLIGYENGRLIFKEKEQNTNNIYYSWPKYSTTNYQELKANNLLEVNMIYSAKHPSLWEIDSKSIEEVLNEKN